MKKYSFLFLLVIIFSSIKLIAQPGNTGMRFSHYGGTMSTYENPAFGANSHTKWEFQLFNINEMMENNQLTLDWRSILDGDNFNLIDSGGRQQQSLVPGDFNFRNVLEIYGPAVFFSYKKKFAFGINTRTRFFFQLNDANLDLADAVLSDDNFDFQTYGPIREDFVNLNVNLMTDIGLTGSALVMNTKRHKLYAGGSLRFYQGLAALDFTGRNIDIDPNKIINADSVVEFSADMQFNASTPASTDILSGSDNVNFESLLRNPIGNAAGSGVGFDIGAVYQGEFLNRSFKASASITDIGSINYNKGIQRNASFIANNVQIPIDSFDNFPDGYDSIKAWAAGYGVTIDSGNASFTQSLPTRLNLYGEVQLLKGFHLGLASSANLAGNDGRASSYSSYTAIIPRWQSRMLEAWVPVSYNYFSKNMKAGVGFRLAYLYFGSDDILGLVRSDAKSVNFYLGLRVSGNYSKKKVKKAEKGKK